MQVGRCRLQDTRLLERRLGLDFVFLRQAYEPLDAVSAGIAGLDAEHVGDGQGAQFVLLLLVVQPRQVQHGADVLLIEAQNIQRRPFRLG